MNFGLIIIGDEILSGKRADRHLAYAAELLHARGLPLGWARYVGDEPESITQVLVQAFASGDAVFCCGGIGATPDDHTRACAARALQRSMVLHPEAEALIRDRMQELARTQGVPYESEHPDNVHRLNMGVFPQGARIIPNPYNRIPGFFCSADDGPEGASGIYFLPGFPVMAHPMMCWVLDTYYPAAPHSASSERSVIVQGAMEAALTPLMLDLERNHPGVKVFSLPSVDHPEYGRHIELGVKGQARLVVPAYEDLLAGLRRFGCVLGPELVRN